MQESTNPTYYIFQLSYDGDSFAQTDKLSPVPYIFDYETLDITGELTGQVIGMKGELLAQFKYNLAVGDNNIFVPFFPDSASIQLLTEDNKIQYKYDISNISTCNKNKTCEPASGETYVSCPTDCEAPQLDMGSNNTYTYLIIAAVVLSLIVGIAIVVLWIKGRQNN